MSSVSANFTVDPSEPGANPAAEPCGTRSTPGTWGIRRVNRLLGRAGRRSGGPSDDQRRDHDGRRFDRSRTTSGAGSAILPSTSGTVGAVQTASAIGSAAPQSPPSACRRCRPRAASAIGSRRNPPGSAPAPRRDGAGGAAAGWAAVQTRLVVGRRLLRHCHRGGRRSDRCRRHAVVARRHDTQDDDRQRGGDGECRRQPRASRGFVLSEPMNPRVEGSLRCAP